MSNSTTNLDLIDSSQAGKEITANALFDAASPATTFGRRASACIALTWSYYGGAAIIGGAPTLIANGALALDANGTNFLELRVSDGVVVKNSSAWTGTGYTALYKVATGASAVLSFEDYRSSSGQSGEPGGPGAPGLDGAAGSVWLSGVGAPFVGAGVNGDYYLNTTTGDYFTKAAGAWNAPLGNLTGPTGTSGAASGALSVFWGTFPGTTGNVIGTQRKYLNSAITIIKLSTWASSAVPSDTTVTLKKNGASIATAVITSGGTAGDSGVVSLSISPGDYLTTDITSTGAVDVGLCINY